MARGCWLFATPYAPAVQAVVGQDLLQVPGDLVLVVGHGVGAEDRQVHLPLPGGQRHVQEAQPLDVQLEEKLDLSPAARLSAPGPGPPPRPGPPRTRSTIILSPHSRGRMLWRRGIKTLSLMRMARTIS